jgi:drug/metabolite transporter (DMT)-like permease
MYYYILAHMEVSRVSLITLITPVCALVLGYVLNSEPVTLGILLGTGFILVGLLFHVYGRGIISYVLKTS